MGADCSGRDFSDTLSRLRCLSLSGHLGSSRLRLSPSLHLVWTVFKLPDQAWADFGGERRILCSVLTSAC